ncbi:hypothetical protein N7457_000111 [Penicillium paradoxum]|uniref:uncharacterized protein n=1 Tax=Penicillium paradoxum TaxID=176176 RepID=UPI0025495062|nr:uncharacterized protein N7457_000111 [Penicillium paradoxum]KAJ5793512.1 hypothetical protein N7457_000111 [Penicillium paradoxum]
MELGEAKEAPASIIEHPPNGPETEIKYPDPVYGAFGETENGPLFWAKRAQEAPWGRCFNALHTKGSLLHRMVGMTLLREPMLQRNSKNNKRKTVDGEAFNGQIAQFLYTAEALLAHAVGERLPTDQACTSCKKRNGKFVSCVLVPGQSHCTNCLWPNQTDRCKFETSTECVPNRCTKTRKRKIENKPHEGGMQAKKRRDLGELDIIITSMEWIVCHQREVLEAGEEQLRKMKAYRQQTAEEPDF